MDDNQFKELLAVADKDKAEYWVKLQPLLEAGELTEAQYNEAYPKLSMTKYGAARQAYSIGSSKKPAQLPIDKFFKEREPLFKGDLKKFSLQWWANYFYQECDDATKKSVFREVYRLDKGLLSLKTQLDDIYWFDCMERMLKNGFTEFPPEFRSTDDVLLPLLREDSDLKVGFRGELRQPFDVRRHNGCRPRAHILSMLPEMNINKPWHPFNAGRNRTKLYYRKGNGDNCLHTAVSVAVDFGTASKFPLLSDLNEADDLGTATVEAEGILSNVAQLRAQMADVLTKQHFDPGRRATDAKPGYAPGKMPAPSTSQAVKPYKAPSGIRLLRSVRMNVYLFLLKGAVYDTRGYQEHLKNAPFPERAAEAIPWEHFIARVMIDRIQYGPDSNDGHLNVIYGWEFLHTRRDLEQALGGGLDGALRMGALSDYLQDLCRRGKLNGDGSGGLPFTTAASNPAVRITKVLKIEPRRDWGRNPAR